MALPVEVRNPIRVIGKTVRTPLQTIPGIPGGLLYTTGDAFGAKFEIEVPRSGILHTAVFIDKDDEGIETDLVLFVQDFLETTDNSEFTVVDADFHSFLSTITFSTFKNFALNQVSSAAAIGLAYNAPLGKLFAQCVTRGGPTIAAGSSPMIALTILSDEP